MKRFAQTIWKLLPRRRRRFWRYVSPRRRGAGILTLALLLLLVYGYWYQTNARQVRRKAESYLSDLTGWQAKIHKARFRLFGGIELEKVRLYLPGSDSPAPFVRAERVTMRHRPWSLLMTGRVEPTEIICVGVTVNLEYQTDTGTYFAKELIARARKRKSGWNPQSRLPVIRIRSGRLVVVDVENSVRTRAGELPLEVSMRPGAEGMYIVSFEGSDETGHRPMRGEVTLDLTRGDIPRFTGVLPLESLDKTLPRRYRLWSRRYSLAGDIRLRRSKETADDANDANGENGENDESILVAELIDVSMKLPDEEGGLKLQNVSGRIEFTPNGVTLSGISGRIVQADNARFEMSGQYVGYESDGPYKVRFDVREMAVPKSDEATGELAETLKDIERTYQPRGRMDVTVYVERNGAGEVSYRGTARPLDMAIRFKHFPYPLEALRGRIDFEPGHIRLEKLTAQRGRTKMVLTGVIDFADGRKTYDVSVVAGDVPFDAELHDAIPAEYLRVWDALSPTGQSDVNVRVYRTADDDRANVNVHLALKGKASLAYKGFPYRVNELNGDVHITGRNVRIESVTGRRGPASCTIDGVLEEVGTSRAKVELDIKGDNVPLDAVLADAAGKAGQKALDALSPEGSARTFHARVWKDPNGPLDYRIQVALESVSLQPKVFPYRIDDAAGALTIRPGVAIIEELRGSHGQTTVQVSGQVFLNEVPGLDLQIDANDVVFDAEFYAALPENLRIVWDQLSPTGRADLSLALQRDVPGRQDDYTFVANAREMAIFYDNFPYPFRGISGKIIAKPGEVKLVELRCKSGQMSGMLDGVFRRDADSQRASFVITGENIPIDEDLRAALPAELASLARRFDSVGTCDIDLKRLEFVLPNTDGATTRPQATGPAARWQVEGSITLHHAQVNLGFGKKSITGRVVGKASREQAGLALDAEIALDTVTLGPHKVTNVRGHLIKPPTGNVIKIENMEAEFHGGWLAGFAEVELSEPLRYGLNLTVDRVQLKRLFDPDGRAASKPAAEVEGLLTGSLQLTEIAGQVDSRLAKGVLRISEGKLYKLPVMLDMLTVVYLSLPQGKAFSEGEFVYHLRGRKLVFEEIHLHSPSVTLVGSGTMDMDSQKLKLTFLSGPPGKLPRVGGLTDELLTGLFREIMEIEVTGTLSDPKMRTKTLGSLEGVVLKLLAPGREEP